MPTFDHHCIWLNQCVGELNYRYFLAFLATHVAFFAYAVFVITSLFIGEVKDDKLFDVTFLDTSTGREFKADFWNVAQYVITKNLGLCMLNIFAGIMDLVLIGFLSYHLYLVHMGQTTNESFKWASLIKVHAKLTAAYKKYLTTEKSKTSSGRGDSTVDTSIPVKPKSSANPPENLVNGSGSTAAVMNAAAQIGGSKNEEEDENGSAVISTAVGSSKSSSASDPDFESLGDEYVCVDSLSILEHLSSEGQEGLVIDQKKIVTKVVKEVDSVVKSIVRQEEKGEVKAKVEVEVEPSREVPVAYRHLIRDIIESHQEVPDVLEHSPGPLPPNIYRKSFMESMR